MKTPEKKQPDLAVEIEFLEALRARMPDDEDTLKILANDYTRVGRLKEGLDVDQRLARLLPNDDVVQYNLACSLSLVGRLKESADTLLRAIELGYDDWEALLKDPDLANLRQSEEFKGIQPLVSTKPPRK